MATNSLIRLLIFIKSKNLFSNNFCGLVNDLCVCTSVSVYVCVCVCTCIWCGILYRKVGGTLTTHTNMSGRPSFFNAYA